MADAEFKRFKELLIQNKHYVTMPRMRLFSLLQKYPALSLKELVNRADKHDRATVYRNINLFEGLGIVNKLWLGWQTKVELSDVFHHHHHHLSCINCGQIWDLDEDPVIEARIAKLASSKNFKPADHQLEIRGLCSTCSKKTA